MEDGSTPHTTGRRRFLRRTAGLAAGAAVVPALVGAGGGTASAASRTADRQAPGADPDALFTAGRFAEADRGYAALLREDPDDAHATARRGYIALLSNRFGDAEAFLTRAVALDPQDVFPKRQLVECYLRQDRLDRAVPLMPDSGPGGARAVQYASVTGIPYEVRGAQAARVPMLGLDPLPHVEASVAGGRSQVFLLDTGATLSLSGETARRAGLRAVSSSTGFAGGRTVTMYYGVAESFRIGGVELHNVPVDWFDLELPGGLPDGSQPAGTIGTAVFQRFLTTMDYAGRALVLRRKTAAQLRAFRAGAAGAKRLPLWLGDHFPCTLGSLNDYGPRVASLDTGGLEKGVNTSVANAERAGIAIDWDHPMPGNGGTSYPITPERISLGSAVRRNLPGTAGPTPFDAILRFETIGNFTHEFFKPYAVTFDFTAMHLYIQGPGVRGRGTA